MRTTLLLCVAALSGLPAATLAQSYPAKPIRFVVPVVADFLPGYSASQWRGLLAPAKTPPEIVSRLNTEINRILGSEEMKPRLVEQGAELMLVPADAFTRYVRDEIVKWRKIVKERNLQS